MDVVIRDASPQDASFLAWVMQAAARSHRTLCFWDLAIPGPDPFRLEHVAAMANAEPRSFTHHDGFIVAESDGRPVAALSAYDSADKDIEAFITAFALTLADHGWTREHVELAMGRTAPVQSCMSDSPPGVWIVEWVAALPEARGRGVARMLLEAILERGRERGYSAAQISYLIGNDPARIAYERVGFETVDEKRDPAFEQVFGSPGLARMTREL